MCTAARRCENKYRRWNSTGVEQRLHVELNCVVHRTCCPHSLQHRYNFTSRCYLIREESTSEVQVFKLWRRIFRGLKVWNCLNRFSNCTLRKMSFSEGFDKRELLLGYLQISPPSSPKNFDIRSNFLTINPYQQLIIHFKIKVGATWMSRLYEMAAC